MNTKQRIEIGAAGLGEASEEDIDERARRIAASEGRKDVNARDREEARFELLHPTAETDAPEELIEEGDRPDSGVPPHSSGEKVVTDPSVDEETIIAEDLIREGVEEAEFDTRFEAGRRLED